MFFIGFVDPFYETELIPNTARLANNLTLQGLELRGKSCVNHYSGEGT